MTMKSTPAQNKRNPTSPSLNHSLAGLSTITAAAARKTDDESERAEALLEIAIGLVDSALDILWNHLKTDEQLRKRSVLLPGGSVGKHFRHVIETYRALLTPLKPRSPSPPPERLGPLIVNYDTFQPSNRRPLARSLDVCRKAMTGVRDDLVAWGERCSTAHAQAHGASRSHTQPSPGSKSTPANATGTGLRHLEKRSIVAAKRAVSSSPQSDGVGLAAEMRRSVRLQALTPTKQELDSSIGREIWFCSLHAIHHFSMLRTIAVHELGLDLPVEFGTAPSTLLYRDKNWQPPDEKSIQLVKAKL